MEIIDLTCPHCGAAMRPDASLSSAHCEFCGHTLLFSEKEQKALRNRRENPPKPVPQTETERYRQKLAEEKKNNPPSAGSADDEGIGQFLMRLFGLRFRFRRLLSVLLLVAVTAASAALALPLYREAFLTYYLIAGVLLTAAGAFCVWISFRVYRTVPLGLGIGILLALLIGVLR